MAETPPRLVKANGKRVLPAVWRRQAEARRRRERREQKRVNDERRLEQRRSKAAIAKRVAGEPLCRLCGLLLGRARVFRPGAKGKGRAVHLACARQKTLGAWGKYWRSGKGYRWWLAGPFTKIKLGSRGGGSFESNRRRH